MQLTCPTKAQLRDYLEGSLGEADSELILAHVNECPICEDALAAIETAQDDVLNVLREGVRTEVLLQEPEFEELRNTLRTGRDDTTPDLNDEEPLEKSRRLRDYRLVKKIGEGGMGTVYQAVHVHLAKPVALKILPVDKLQSKQSVRRFRQEMRAVGRVNHPNVVSASDAGKIDGQHFLVMELVQGADLARIIRDQGSLSVADACEIVRQAATGLQHAHDNGLVHRDVKPSNVMLTVDGSVKVLDLGLASLNNTSFEASANVVVKEGLTSVGQIMGTLDFMAPEQITASPDVDGRADVYALGTTLFQLLTSRTPCGDRSQETPQRIEAVLNQPPLDIAALRNDVPEELRALLMRMLAKNPEDRPQSASDIANEIEPFAVDSNLIALADACRTSLDMPSADVDVTDDASFLVSRMIEPEKQKTKRKPLIAIGFSLFFALAAAAVFFIATNNGAVKVEVLDDSFQVAIDDKTLTVTEEGTSQPINLRVGDHKLTVKVGGTEFATSDFEIRRNDQVAFRIEPLEGKVIVTRDGMQVASKPMPGIVAPETSKDKDNDPQVAEASAEPKAKLLTDLPASDLSAIYQALTGAELGGSYVADKPNPGFANDLNILLANKAISRDAIAKHLVEQGRPDLAEYVLVDGRIKPSATEALKLADLLVESGDGAKAIDSYLQAFRIAPLLFDPWEHIEIFDKQNRLKDLAELFTEERIRETKGGSVDPLHYLLKRLMKDDVRASLGIPFAVRLWNGRPDMRPEVLDETPMSEVPNRAEWYETMLIPEDVEKVGKGWHWLFFHSGTSGGFLYELRNILDKEAARQLIIKIKPLVEKHESWIAGQLTLAAMEAIAGNYEPAKQWIKDNHETVREFKQESDYHELLWWYAEYLGDVLGGRDRELDEQVIKLYEESLDHRSLKSLYRKTCVHQLAGLYHKFGRKQDALDLLYGLAVRERDIDEYVGSNWSNPKAVNLDLERIWDIRTAVATLNGIGYPMDALSLLSRIDFEQRRRAGIFKGGWEYRDDFVVQATSESQKLLNTNAIVEAINRGVIPVGLASTIDKESGGFNNPIVELLSQVARKELSGQAAASFESVNAKLADADAMDQHLSDLMKQHPADVDIAVAAAIFAFLRDDIETAAKRLQVLDSSLGADYEARAADVNLYLAAGFAKKHADTADIGARLAKRAAESGKKMNDQWKQFFEEKKQTSDEQAGLQPTKTLAELPWSDLAVIHQQVTGGPKIGGTSDKPSPQLAASINVLLDFYDKTSREEVAKKLVDLGKPELAKIVLSDGRVDPAASEAIKLGGILKSSGEDGKAVDAYLEAFRLSPRLFSSKYIKIFDEQNRLDELAEVFTEQRLKRTRYFTEPLLGRLMQDDVRASVGMPYMRRVWNARPILRSGILREVPWTEVPDRVELFAPLLIPANIEEAGSGWDMMFTNYIREGGFLDDLRNFLDDDAARQLIARVKPKVEEHKNWSAGQAILAILESDTGNVEPAKVWITQYFKNDADGKSQAGRDKLRAQHADGLADMLHGKDPELDALAIKIYEYALQNRSGGTLYRKSGVHRIAKLYHKYNRTNDAIELLYGLAERERKVDEYLSENLGKPDAVNLDQERIADFISAAETLNGIGRPMDSLLLLSRVTFEQRRAAAIYKGGSYGYNDIYLDWKTNASNKLVTANVVAEALNRGVIPIGLASTISEKSGEMENPIVKLLEQVARKELSDEAAAAFESVNAKLADSDAMDEHLMGLMKQQPADVDIAVAATIFAFQRNDIKTAAKRLQVLDSSFGADYKARAADVNLYLAASHAVPYSETAELGRRLAKRALQSGKNMNDDWKKFFQDNQF